MTIQIDYCRGPFDPRSLQPGDCYVANDGTKGTFCGSWGEWLWLHNDEQYSPQPFHVTNRTMGKYPAGPWVEPTKPRQMTVEVGMFEFATGTAVSIIHRDSSAKLLARKTVTLTEGEGML